MKHTFTADETNAPIVLRIDYTPAYRDMPADTLVVIEHDAYNSVHLPLSALSAFIECMEQFAISAREEYPTP